MKYAVQTVFMEIFGAGAVYWYMQGKANLTALFVVLFIASMRGFYK